MRGIPKNLASIKNKIKKYTILNPHKRKKSISINKKYRDIEWKKTFTVRESIELLKDEAFHSYEWLKKRGRIRKENGKVSGRSLLSELFKREVAYQVESNFWNRNKKARKNYRMKYKKGLLFSIEINDVKHNLCKLPKDIKQKGESIKQFLYKNQFIFDKNNPYFLSDVQIRKMIRENLLYGSISSFDIISYIKDLKKTVSK